MTTCFERTIQTCWASQRSRHRVRVMEERVLQDLLRTTLRTTRMAAVMTTSSAKISVRECARSGAQRRLVCAVVKETASRKRGTPGLGNRPLL
eukprot:1108058-Rhodomonas_salina.1